MGTTDWLFLLGLVAMVSGTVGWGVGVLMADRENRPLVEMLYARIEQLREGEGWSGPRHRGSGRGRVIRRRRPGHAARTAVQR